ncbi:hypothetical protein EVAR_13615_1 [Eumeta japonica]|uniref:Uncharacterized protein n=1 Tax=Eumeta variegata TaxID=151549 RepID=A0A4C1UUM3_EUMVA|nr:hypothetical protein EVAR_13615_1 [Eumeta japonica]
MSHRSLRARLKRTSPRPLVKTRHVNNNFVITRLIYDAIIIPSFVVVALVNSGPGGAPMPARGVSDYAVCSNTCPRFRRIKMIYTKYLLRRRKRVRYDAPTNILRRT